MRLLLFSDIHCDEQVARRLVAESHRFDIAVGAGDFANARRGLPEMIAVLRSMKCKTVLVPGNSESFDELTEACAGWKGSYVLHGTSCEIGGQTFFGLGGAVPETPFGSWSYDFSEVEAAELLDTCPQDCVLVTHSPPKEVLDRSSGGVSLGSTAVRDAVLRTNPRLVVCGHIHACGGQQARLKNAAVVNAGPDGVPFTLEE